MNSSNVQPADGLFREAAPRHFLLKVESFSLLCKNSIVKYESNDFEAGGHKWKILLYPDGNKEIGNGHVSLYLELVGTGSLPAYWEYNVFFRLFMFDHIRDRYLVRGGTMDGRTHRFHAMKTVWGFPQFVSHQKFKDASNGYLVDDTCVFGAEVLVSKPTKNYERLSMVKVQNTAHRTWTIEDFSKIKEEKLSSDVFEAGDLKWNIILHAKGNGKGKDKYVSLYLNSPSCKETPGLRVYADFVLRLKDQIHGKHCEHSTDKHWFASSSEDWGWTKFIKLGEMNDTRKGFLVKDACIVEVKLNVLGLVRETKTSAKKQATICAANCRVMRSIFPSFFLSFACLFCMFFFFGLLTCVCCRACLAVLKPEASQVKH